MKPKDLLQLALGNKETIEQIYDQDWKDAYLFAQKQSISGILFSAIEKLPETLYPNKSFLLKWYGQAQCIQRQNIIVNQRAKELTSLFSEAGFRTCILKGQGNSQYYPVPSLRQSGDIDIWIDASREDIITFACSHGIKVHDIHLVHATAAFFDDVVVELHFRPSWMYNPILNRKLQVFFKEESKTQFQLYDKNLGYTHPANYFNLVYNLIHINRHIFDEGIGLRQVVDYYYILLRSDTATKRQAMSVIKSLKIERFASALMYVMVEELGASTSILLCPPNKKYGERLLRDILEGGNFGQFGKHAITTTNEQRWKRGFDNIKRNAQFIFAYPQEVLWIPYFKIAHYLWRKNNGYL